MMSALQKPDLGAKFSIVIPAFNEEEGIGVLLEDILAHRVTKNFEVIVVDDGSSDGTREIVKERFPSVVLVTHERNLGYGSAIRSATAISKGDYIIWFDSDGQHRLDDLIEIAGVILDENLDYVIGVRDKRSHEVMGRKFGKAILRVVVGMAAGRQIQDFNCGLRAFKRNVLVRYLHFLPKGFGASTTTTLLMLERGYRGKFYPVIVKERVGKSSVRQIRDGMRTMMLILRIFLIFKPMRFFGTIGAIAVAVGSVYGLWKAFDERLGFPVLAAVVILFGVQSLFFGLLCDQIAGMRRERMEA